MPTYEYRCNQCQDKFEQFQSMLDAPLTTCPSCHGPVQRLISGGAGFILRSAAPVSCSEAGTCSTNPQAMMSCPSAGRCGVSCCG